MRVPVVEYITLALSSGLTSYGVPGPQSVEVVSSDLRVMDATTPSCWAPASGVSANYGPINDLRTDASVFCNAFSSNNTGITVGSGKFIFGWQSAIFVGNFASWSSCMNTFNTLVTACYGTASPTKPVSLGGNIADPGGANLVISFGNGAQF